MIFSEASVSSITAIKGVLQEFTDLSGLTANHLKSEVFFEVPGLNEKKQILEVLQFKEGVLPVRYLGLPLITGTL